MEDEDVLDDPIRLWDSDERAVFYSYRFKNTTSHYAADRREQLKELLTQSQIAPDPSENLTFPPTNLPKCRPCSVQIVDCHKYPQFNECEYKTKSLIVTLEDVTVIDDQENIRQYSYSNEDVEYKQDASKSKEKFDTAESITLYGGGTFVNEETYNDNQTLDLQVKLMETQTMEIDHSLGRLNNADQTFDGSGKACNDLTTSKPLYEKHKIGTPTLASIKIDNYWSFSKYQDNYNKEMIESKKITANKLINKRKQIQNKAYSLSKEDYKTTNSVKFNQIKRKNINQNMRSIRWMAPALTDPVSERVSVERVPLYHQNCSYRSFGRQKIFNSSHKMIPHYHEHPFYGEEGNDRNNAMVAHHPSRNFNSCNPLNATLTQNKSVDDCYIIDSNELHYEVNNFNTNHMFDVSQVNSLSNNSGVCTESNSIYKYIDSEFGSEELIDSGGGLISQGPEIFRTLDEERSLYQFNSSCEHESIFSPFYLTSLDCNIYDISNNYQNVDLFPMASSESMMYNNVGQVESVSARPNETYLEKYMNFLKNLNEETLINEVTNNQLFEIK